MIGRRQYVLLLTVLLIGLPTFNMYAPPAQLDWWQDEVVTSDRGVSAVTDGDSLKLTGAIAIDGEVVVENTLGSGAELLVVIDDTDAFLFPASVANPGFGHLMFYAAKDSKITVDVSSGDLIFTGSNWGDNHVNNEALTITFSGPGQTEFKIGPSHIVGFEGFFGNGGNTATDFWDDYSSTGSGVHAYITMDQDYDDAVKDGINKVVFTRLPWAQGVCGDTAKVSIGRYSYMTYLSTNKSGVECACTINCEDMRHAYGTLAFDPSVYDNTDLGRLLLHIKGSYWVDSSGTVWGTPFAYNDGGLMVAGHFVESFTNPIDIRDVSLNMPGGVEAIIRIIDETAYTNTSDSSYRDDLIAKSPNSEPEITLPTRRGLLVLNENKSLARFTADPYVNNDWQNQFIKYDDGIAKNNRPGFIIGNNGHMEIFHNTFLDYVAASTMMIDQKLYDRSADVDPGNPSSWNAISQSLLKLHNPSALVIDGLALYDAATAALLPYVYDQTTNPNGYQAHLAEVGGRHAHVTLRGDARMYLRSGVGNDGYVSGKDGYIVPGGSCDDRVYTFTINYDLKECTVSQEGSYDGTIIIGNGSDGRPTYLTRGEGNHVLDVEGKLTVRATDDDNSINGAGFLINHLHHQIDPNISTVFVRHPITSALKLGMLNLPGIKIDQMGREIANDAGTLVERPLSTESTYYPVYNSSSILLNDEMALHNVFFEHNDPLKVVGPDPVTAEPAIVGGEKAVYDKSYLDTYKSCYPDQAYKWYALCAPEKITTKVPLLSLFDSTVRLHEALGSSGIRWVVTDKFAHDLNVGEGFTSNDATLVGNTSTLMSYNHGDLLDTLNEYWGRVFIIGSMKNVMADGSTNDFTKNAYLNIYRSWDDPSISLIVKLALQTDLQPLYTAQYGSNVLSTLQTLDDQNKGKAYQLFYLGNNSFASVGWTTTYGDQVISPADIVGKTITYTYGINEGIRPRPWDEEWNHSVGVMSGSCLADYIFTLSDSGNKRAVLSLEGDHYYFGAKDEDGKPAVGCCEKTLCLDCNKAAGVVYADFGGLISTINYYDETKSWTWYPDTYVDTVFAYRQWPHVLNADLDMFIDDFSGLIDLPHDQVKFGKAMQPYCLDFPTMLTSGDGQTKENNIRLNIYDEKTNGVAPPTIQKASGEEVTIAWNKRVDNPSSPQFVPVKSFMIDPNKDVPRVPVVTRGTHVITSPYTMPDSVLTVSTGDVISQLRVSGATAADPFHIYVSGGPRGYGIVREFTSVQSDCFVPGEGAHGVIFMDGGAHIGLGVRDWNENSVNAWNLLGHDYITLAPNGNGVIEVMSDMIIADKLPFVPTANFGSKNGNNQSLQYSSGDQRLIFHSDVPREIRIPSGGELDLSAFGKVADPSASPFSQIIEFGGKIRFVIEPGAKIRFPSNPDQLPVLYFNDDAELIFLGSNDGDEFVWEDYKHSEAVRTKILGKGQIWLNKDAKMLIMSEFTHVGVETDEQTPETDITISIQRAAGMYVGDETTAGGCFQVGNPIDKGDSHDIKFTFRLNGARSKIHLDRLGMIGLGVGVINKFHPVNKYWRLEGMHNISEINCLFREGILDHSNIFDGDSDNGSLLAIGPATTYNMQLGKSSLTNLSTVIVRGGGNIMYMANKFVPTYTNGVLDAGVVGMYPNTGGTLGNGAPLPPSYLHDTDHILSTAVATGATLVDGSYSILSSRHILKQNTAIGTATITRTPSATGSLIQIDFSGTPSDFFKYLQFTPLGTQPEDSYVTFGQTQLKNRVGYVIGTAITRDTDPKISDQSDPADAAHFGVLGVSLDPTNIPVDYAGVNPA